MKIEVILKIIREENQNQRIADIRENISFDSDVLQVIKKMLADKVEGQKFWVRILKFWSCWEQGKF